MAVVRQGKDILRPDEVPGQGLAGVPLPDQRAVVADDGGLRADGAGRRQGRGITAAGGYSGAHPLFPDLPQQGGGAFRNGPLGIQQGVVQVGGDEFDHDRVPFLVRAALQNFLACSRPWSTRKAPWARDSISFSPGSTSTGAIFST